MFGFIRQLSSDKDVTLRFDGIRQSEDDRTRRAIFPEFSEITADLIAHNLLVLLHFCTHTHYARGCNLTLVDLGKLLTCDYEHALVLTGVEGARLSRFF